MPEEQKKSEFDLAKIIHGVIIAQGFIIFGELIAEKRTLILSSPWIFSESILLFIILIVLIIDWHFFYHYFYDIEYRLLDWILDYLILLFCSISITSIKYCQVHIAIFTYAIAFVLILISYYKLYKQKKRMEKEAV